MSLYSISSFTRAKIWLALIALCGLSACAKDIEPTPYQTGVNRWGMVYDNYQSPDLIIDPSSEYIMVLGDVQEYTDNKNSVKPLHRTLLWAVSQKHAYDNMACILQVGDVTNSNEGHQWDRFDDAIRNVVEGGLPVFSCTGNHDYRDDGGHVVKDRNSTRINDFLHYCFPDSLVKARFEAGKVENLILRLPLKNISMDLILLEFGPRTEVVDWAIEWVKAHPEQKFMLMTHEMLWSDGELIAPGAWNCYARQYFQGTASTWTSPKELVDRLLKPYPNIVAALSGHNGFALVNDLEQNVNGRPIPLIQFNLQYQENAGDSMALLLRFDKVTSTVDCTVYRVDSRSTVETPISGYSFPFGD